MFALQYSIFFLPNTDLDNTKKKRDSSNVPVVFAGGNHMKAAGLIAVAGQSSRMGAFKPLLPIHGKPMIAHTADVFLRAGVTDLYVVVGKYGEDVIRALSGYHAAFLWNHDYAQTEMFASVQLGLRAIRDTGKFDGAFLLPGDMPAVPSQVLRSLLGSLETSENDVVFPSDGTRRLHPPLIRSKLFDSLIDYSGEDGLRGAFRALNARIGYVVTSDAGCQIDVDTPEDYERARAFLEHREGEVKSE